MKHIYKAKGPFKKESKTYDVKTVHTDSEIPKGWFETLEEALKPAKKVKTDDN